MYMCTCIEHCHMYLVRVPIRVKYDDSVSNLQIEPQPTSAGAQQEDKVWRVSGSEQVQQLFPLISLCGSIQTEVR